MARGEVADGDIGCLLHIFVVLCAVLSFDGCFLSINFIATTVYGHLCCTRDLF